LLYWRYGEYVGVGPGAHGRLVDGKNTIATITEKHPETWRQQVQTRGHGLTSAEVIDPAAQAREMLLMGLRIAEGIDLSRYEQLAGKPMARAKLTALTDLGLLTMRGNSHLAATQAGRHILNAVIADLAD
jgi:coproporphyrinogen III oxidase-like Fe-S oxidoreductase